MKVKIYFFKDAKNMPFDVQQDIIIFGQPRIEFVEKYYECVYEIDEKRKIRDIELYLKYLVQKFTFKESPLMTKEKSDYLKSIDCHSGISIGDVISIDNDFYAVEYGKCEKMKN